jgi:hypothetical protein
MAILALYLPAFSTAGIGFQYGYDLSLSMPNETGEQANLTDLSLNTNTFGGAAPSSLSSYITGKELPIYIDRTAFTRNWFDVGGKVYVDCIPLIDALELSTNYGMWEYQGSIKYPTSITFRPGASGKTFDTSMANIVYDSTNITMKNLGLTNPFIQQTPFAKLQFDLTLRKYILKLPPMANTLRFYGGGGISMYFATPLLSANLIQKAIGTTLTGIDSLQALSKSVFDQRKVEQDIADEFLKELFTSHWGAHLDLGAMLKAPFMPVGIYVDAKYLIPFGPLDPNVPALKSNGFLLNGGVALDF